MTLLTTIINKNIRCIAGDTKFTPSLSSYLNIEKPKKVFILKDAILGLQDYIINGILINLLKNSKKLSLDDCFSEMIDAAYTYREMEEFTGFTILKKNEAYLKYLPWNLSFEIAGNNCYFQKGDKILNELSASDLEHILEFLNRNVFFNLPLSLFQSNIQLDLKLYNDRYDCFMSTLLNNYGIQDIQEINHNNFKDVIWEFYSRVISNKNLHKDIVGGGLHIAYINNNGDYKMIFYESLKNNEYSIVT